MAQLASLTTLQKGNQTSTGTTLFNVNRMSDISGGSGSGVFSYNEGIKSVRWTVSESGDSVIAAMKNYDAGTSFSLTYDKKDNITIGGTKQIDVNSVVYIRAGGSGSYVFVNEGENLLVRYSTVTTVATLLSTINGADEDTGGNETIAGTLSVTGATSLASTLSVSGATTLTGAVVMAGALTIAGSITTAGDLAVEGGDIDAGKSGAAGTVDIFPATASKGKTTFSSTDNAGDTTTAIVTAAQAGARTYTIPDSGASTASFLMNNTTPVAVQQALSGPGAITITEFFSVWTSTGTGDALTLVNGATIGQRKKILYTAEGAGADTGVLTPTSLVGGTTLTFNATGEIAVLEWNGTGWVPVELYSQTVGAAGPVLA
jgi:hypothetical protein